jgi:hypothetical protein
MADAASDEALILGLEALIRKTDQEFADIERQRADIERRRAMYQADLERYRHRTNGSSISWPSVATVEDGASGTPGGSLGYGMMTEAVLGIYTSSNHDWSVPEGAAELERRGIPSVNHVASFRNATRKLEAEGKVRKTTYGRYRAKAR